MIKIDEKIMTIDDAIKEWESAKRSMGCVAATDWFCKRVPGFSPLRLSRFTSDGDFFQHVVATDGRIIIDLSPYADHPKGEIGNYGTKSFKQNLKTGKFH